MPDHAVVTRQEWTAARQALLAKEKEFTRLRDELSRERRALPWMRIEKSYAFETPVGRKSLTELFDGRRQLVVYHFMFAPDWQVPCKSCSFWADNFNGIVSHLHQRDVTMLAISRAPLAKLEAFKQRIGWSFPWISSDDGDFNFDLGVSFRPQDLAAGEVDYNFRRLKTSMSDLPGISVFYRDDDGTVFRTYSCYSRGVDMMNTAYHYLDLTPKGRDEDGLPRNQAWVRFHDEYGE
ncbi:MAG TPA: thioredoxin family protein [Stellaceae bacterium]|nr:thioredoxin family protein [Stellaceae bacterium]